MRITGLNPSTNIANRYTGLMTISIAALLFLVAVTSVSAAKPIVTDMTITDAVEDQLRMDNSIVASHIDVSTVNGIVNLYGSVENVLAKERAARIAKIVKGVRSVINEIEVEPFILRTDRQISDDIKEALIGDPVADVYEIEIQVKDRIVTLSGSVDSWQEKRLAELAAKGVKGVKEVINDIRISRLEPRMDSEIENEVKHILEWDAFIDGALIDVAVKDGKVTLRGVVGSAAEKSWAHLHAYVNGVVSVDSSQLEVKKWARDDDLKGQKYQVKPESEVTRAVVETMLLDPRVSAFNIRAEMAHDGTTVILRGTVDNLKAKRAAAQDARNTVGVWQIDNRIKVKPAGKLSDREIEDRILSAILRDPYLESYDILVEVGNGIAKLFGRVDNYFEKFRADNLVAKIDGVILVDNNLLVQKDAKIPIYSPYVDEDYVNGTGVYSAKPRLPAQSDWQIKMNIMDELFWSPFVDADDVNVTVDDGVVTLTGAVDSWSEYNAAANNAYEGGAIYVDNDLKVKTIQQRSLIP